MTGRPLRRHTILPFAAALAAALGVACGADGAIAPLSSYPCQVGWSLVLVGRDPLQDYYFEPLSEGNPTAARASLVEAGDSIEVALTRIDVTLDPTGTSCVGVQSMISTPWTLIAADPAGVLSIAQPQGSAPAVVRATRTGTIRVRGLIGRDTVGPAWVAAVPRVASLVLTPSDTTDAGALPLTVRVSGRDSLGQAVQLFNGRTTWGVLGTSTIPVALWPTVALVPRGNSLSLDANIAFPTSATSGVARIKFSTRHADATLNVTVPPAP